jgi:hypothetical protein
MKVVAPLVAMLVLSQAAVAQSQDCKSLSGSKQRLACYDRAATPAKAVERPTASKTPNTDPSKYVDTISAEDVRMNAQLKNICRGC